MNFIICRRHLFWINRGRWSTGEKKVQRLDSSQRLLSKTIIRAMKLVIILLTSACLQVSATGYSQTVTFAGTNITLKKVFDVIHTQTGYGVFITPDILSHTNNVTVTFKETDVESAIRTCLEQQKIRLIYTWVGKGIVITRKEISHDYPIVSDTNRVATKIVARGIVYNENGQPLSGANVVIKESGKGTVTNAKGEFLIPGVLSTSTLVISFIGYMPQQIKVVEEKIVQVYLAVAKNELDKVVVQAYGTTTQRLATGNIGVVRAEDIAKQPVMNVLQAMQGHVAGAVVTNTSGYASSTIKVEIRGRNTINPNFPSDPLYIIDGVPLTILDITGQSSYSGGSQGVIQSRIISPANGQSPFFSINPSDIESIEVLKDADATAIYGSRGSNGVILITTKRGKAGKSHVDLKFYQGISEVTRQYQLLNTQQYLKMREEALQNDQLPVDINNAPDLVVWDTTRYTNWQKFAYGKIGAESDAQVSLSGGDVRTTFRLASGYHYQRDLTTVSGGNQRISLAFNFNHKSFDQRFSVSFTGNYNYTYSNLIAMPGNPTLAPNAPAVYNKLGNLNYNGWAPLDGPYPFGSLLQPYISTTNLLTSNAILSYEILKNLELKVSLGYNNIINNQSQITPIASQDPFISPTGTSELGYSLSHNLIAEPQLEYKKFIGKGKLHLLAGATTQTNSTSSIFSEGIGYTNDALLSSISNAPTKITGSYSGKYKYVALFGRINYNWENKYILSINARRDGSSRFGPGRRYGNFASIGGAWVFTEEPWLKKSFLSFGKIRGSYGITGGDQIGDYAYLTQWSFGNNQYNGNQPLTPIKHTDSTLHWQVNHKLEVSLTLGFLNDRITLESSWYRNRCNDQLIQFPTPALSGFTFVTSNSPANVQNTGWEFILNGKIVDNKNFKWSTKLSLGINRNKLLSFPNFSQSPFSNTLAIGKSLNIQKLLHNTGIDPLTGLYTFFDKNHDGDININPGLTDDRYIYDMNPKFDGGFTTDFTYKNWTLSAFFYFRKQLGANAFNSIDFAGDISNQPLEVYLHHWQKPGDNSTYARFTTNPSSDPSYYYYQNSDALYTDASFIRLQNLALAYTFPETVFKKQSTGNLRIYFQCQNIFVITRYKGVDPEIQNFGGIPVPLILTGGISFNL